MSSGLLWLLLIASAVAAPIASRAAASEDPTAYGASDASIEAGDTAASEPAEAAPSRLALTWTAGLDLSRGDYGLEEETTLFYVPLGVTGDWGRFRARLLVPLLVLDGPVRIEPGGAATSGGRTDSDTAVGLGQVQLSAGYLLEPFFAGLPWIELTGRLTLPTETREALGTGDVAFSAQVDLFQSLGPVTPFATLGRKWYDSAGLRDRFFTSVGASLAFGERARGGLAWDWLESITNDAEDAHELVPFVSFDVSPASTLSPYAVIGLTEGSPAWGLGVTVSVRR